jgi:D-alanyl-D-alanine carboxypeptidase
VTVNTSLISLPTKKIRLAVLNAWLGLFALLTFPALTVRSAAIGQVRIHVEFGRAVLSFSNFGQAYVVETATNLASTVWRKRVTITTEASDVSWADEALPSQAMFYRVAAATNSTIFQTLQQALHRACTNQGIVGASAAAFLPNDGLWLGTYGSSDRVSPIRPQTPFEIASVTKTFVATTILRLVEEGRLNLEDTVGRWLPGLNNPNISPAITVRQLLSHRSGMYNFGDDVDFRIALFSDWSRLWQPEDVLNYVKAPYFPPGTDGEYSNSGYVLLGMIIRSVTGSTVAEEMRRTVLDRAGLQSTFMGAEESWSGPLADPHLDFNGDGIQEDLGSFSQTAILTSFWTSGAEISTAADLVQFGVSLFEEGLLNQTSLTAMRTFQSIDVVGTRFDYGLGLMRFNILGQEHWAHSGGLFGEYAWLSYCPATRACLAVAYNYPNVNPGPNLPGELLITLSSLPAVQPGASAFGKASSRGANGSPAVRIPFLNAEIDPRTP